MLEEETRATLEAAVMACDDARQALEEALEGIESGDADADALAPVALALERWRDGQREFMAAVEASSAPDPSTAAMLLKMNHGVDASNARRGLPGVPVEGADQPFDVDLSGPRATAVTNAAMHHVTAPND